MKENRGITLISLAVTILIILILAGITIGILFGDNGIIKKAQEAGDQTEIAVVREKLELAKGTEYIESNGKYNPESYFQIIEDEGIINDKDTDVVDNGDGTYEVTTSGGYIFEITLVPSKDNVENIEIEYIGKADGPRIKDINITNKTTNSVTVEVNATNVKDATYSYYYKKNGDADWTKAGEGKETTYTFNGLETNVAYDIKVVVEEDGKSIEKEIKVTTGNLPVETVKFSDATWSNGEASITISTSETGYTMQYQKGGTEENNWTNITSGTTIENLKHGDIVYVRLYDGTNGSEAVSVTVKDEIEPTVAVTKGAITTNSITVNVSSSDAQYGMPTTPTYNYYIKKSSEADYPTTASHTGTETSYTFSGLTQNTSYDVKVTVADKAGNTGTGTLNATTGQIAGADEGLKDGSITATTPTWSDGTASLTLSTTTGLTIQYQVNGIEEGSWKTGTSVTGLKHNDTVYARLTDGTNYGDYANVTILDSKVPQAATISLSGTSVTTAESITATVTLKDNESGVNVTSSKYIYNTTSGNIGTTSATWNSASSFSSNGQTITLKVATTGIYYLHVLTVDNAGNKTETISSSVTVKAALVADGSYSDTKGVNTPKLGTGMTAVKWNGSSWVETTGDDTNWYDYSNKKWANAKTSDGSMWVWIPRYAYRITSGYHSSTTGAIEVEFMKGTTNTSSSGRTSFSNASGLNNWNIHPAFNYNGTVSGLWVAKFEASRSDATSSSAGSSSTMKIQPGVQSWRSITVNDIYTNCLNYNSTLKSHMMKNSEWGAVAYLTQSTFGKNEEVWINNSGSYITGSAGNSVSASEDTGTTNDYTSTQGQEASTTGNVTGIYDMSGGAWEYVAGYVNNGNSNLTNYGSSLVNGASYTKDVYSVGSSDSNSNNYTANASVYGDAVYETSSSGSGTTSWNSDYSSFPRTSFPFFLRGGYYSDGTDAGVFYFNDFTGYGDGNHSFRPVLVAL